MLNNVKCFLKIIMIILIIAIMFMVWLLASRSDIVMTIDLLAVADNMFLMIMVCSWWWYPFRDYDILLMIMISSWWYLFGDYDILLMISFCWLCCIWNQSVILYQANTPIHSINTDLTIQWTMDGLSYG